MIGVDEVGRGALAGPLLVVAARPLTKAFKIDGIKDSKLLTRAQREALFGTLVSNFEFGEGWVEPAEIDELGLAQSLRVGVVKALKILGAQTSEEIILDGKVNYLPKKFAKARCEIDADVNRPVVSAASIYAKVCRDRFMADLAGSHRKFSFAQHVGYGTQKHYLEIREFGPIKSVHRFSFAPLKQSGLS